MKKWYIFKKTLAIGATLGMTSQLGLADSPHVKLQLSLQYPHSAGKPYFKIFIYNERDKRTTYLNLKESTPGLFVGELQTSQTDPTIVKDYRIGIPSNLQNRYFPFKYVVGKDRIAKIELNGQKVLKDQVEKKPAQEPLPKASVPSDEELANRTEVPVLLSIPTSSNLPLHDGSDIVLYNQKFKRVTYVHLRSQEDQLMLNGRFGVPSNVASYMKDWLFLVPSPHLRKYINFDYWSCLNQKIIVAMDRFFVTKDGIVPIKNSELESQCAEGITYRMMGSAGTRGAIAKDKATLIYMEGLKHFKDKQFEKAAGRFELAKKDKRYSTASKYYIGVCHFNAKNMNKAAGPFRDVASQKVEPLASYSRYYLGLMKVNEKDYEGALSEFEQVNQSIPMSEDMKRNTLNMMTFASKGIAHKQKGEKRLGGSVGLDLVQYDTNVANLPGSLVPVTNLNGFGYGAQLGLWYMPLLTDENELSLNVNFSETYHPNPDFINYDIAYTMFSGRYTRNMTVDGKPVRFMITPGASYMQGQSDGVRMIPPRNQLLNSYFLQNQVFAMGDTGNVEMHWNFKYDTNFLSVQTPDINPSGFGTQVGFTKTEQIDASDFRKNYFWGGTLEWNPTLGRNYQQINPLIFGGISFPTYWEMLMKAKVSFNYDVFYQSDVGRQDAVLRGDLSFVKVFSKVIYATQAFAYTQSMSTVDLGQFSRFVTTTSIGFSF